MSKVVIKGDASGTGTLTIAAPNTNSDITFNLPTSGGTVMTTATSLNSSQISDGSITTAKLSATGTPSSSTYLRGDGSWQSPAGGVTSLNGQTGAITNTDYGAIGSYTFASNGTGASLQVNPGTTKAGNTLYRSAGASDSLAPQIALNGETELLRATSDTWVNLGLTGTWRAMATSKNGSSSGGAYTAINFWVRIS